jgi:hypothetical protein
MEGNALHLCLRGLQHRRSLLAGSASGTWKRRFFALKVGFLGGKGDGPMSGWPGPRPTPRRQAENEGLASGQPGSTGIHTGTSVCELGCTPPSPPQGSNLFYFRGASAARPLGVIPLEGAAVAAEQLLVPRGGGGGGGRAPRALHTLQIAPPSGPGAPQPRHRAYLLAAPSPELQARRGRRRRRRSGWRRLAAQLPVLHAHATCAAEGLLAPDFRLCARRRSCGCRRCSRRPCRAACWWRPRSRARGRRCWARRTAAMGSAPTHACLRPRPQRTRPQRAASSPLRGSTGRRACAPRRRPAQAGGGCRCCPRRRPAASRWPGCRCPGCSACRWLG